MDRFDLDIDEETKKQIKRTSIAAIIVFFLTYLMAMFPFFIEELERKKIFLF